jgi:hypothetical protein
MHILTIEVFRDKAKSDEDFWFYQHRDAQTESDLNNFGWLWIHAKEMREKLDSMMTPNDKLRGCPTTEGETDK